jgi:hypothetical protein
MNQLSKLILNSLTFLAVIIINYLSAMRLITPQSVGDISDKYSTQITPAAYTFAIWGLIYVLLFLCISFQWYVWRQKRAASNLIDKIGYYFIFSNLANIVWVFVWVHDQIALSLLFIGILSGALFKIIQRLDLERWNAPFQVILFVWWPMSIYFGWAVLATLLNVYIFLVSTNIIGTGWSEEIAGILLIFSGTLLYLYLIYTRNLRASAFAGVWGFTGIIFNGIEGNALIVISAISCSVILTQNFH